MKNRICISLLSTLLFSSLPAKAKPAPIQSKEEIEFLSKTEQKMLDLLKTPEFVGIITRTAETNKDLRIVDLYAFKNIQKISMNKELCKRLLSKIYGPLDEISFKVRKVEIYTSHTGNTCEAQLDNEDSKTKIPERRTIVGFLNAQPYAVVFKLSKKSTPSDQENVKKFWDSLR